MKTSTWCSKFKAFSAQGFTIFVGCLFLAVGMSSKSKINVTAMTAMTAMTATGNLNIVFCFPHAKAVGSSREVRKKGLRVLVPVPGLHFQ